MTNELPQCSTCGREAGQSWSPDNHCGTEKTGPTCAPLTPPHRGAVAELWGYFAMQIPGWREPAESLPSSWLTYSHRIVPNPDHWAWEGRLVRLLRPAVWRIDAPPRLILSSIVRSPEEMDWTIHTVESGSFSGITLGRACIAAAAAIGRWPGGGL